MFEFGLTRDGGPPWCALSDGDGDGDGDDDGDGDGDGDDGDGDGDTLAPTST